MRTIEWRGYVTAISSIAHTGKETGTKNSFRREALLLPNGKRLDSVPVVSGSVIKGGIRRIAAAMMHDALVGPGGTLPMPVVHAFRTGGALRETRASEEVLTGNRQAVLRDLLPMLSIFGFSTNGRIVSGRITVDKALPVAEQTIYLIDHYNATLPEGFVPPSIWALIQNEQYTRFADVADSPAQPYIDQTLPTWDLPPGTGNMIWSQDTLLAGTLFFHTIALEEGNPREVSFMDELMRRWENIGRIGAHASRGMGRFTTKYTRSCLDVLGDPLAPEEPTPWRDYVRDNHAEAMDALTWL